MFKIADKVVYGETGVCLIEDICEREFIKKQKKMYYVLRPVQSDGNVIYAPIENRKIAMRKIITKNQAENLIKCIPTIIENINADAELTMQDYKNEIISHNLDKLVELTARIYNKKKCVQLQKKRLNSIDEKYMKIAENLLFGELAEALEINIDEVQAYISKNIEI